jgi:hypothetical protein
LSTHSSGRVEKSKLRNCPRVSILAYIFAVGIPRADKYAFVFSLLSANATAFLGLYGLKYNKLRALRPRIPWRKKGKTKRREAKKLKNYSRSGLFTVNQNQKS